MSAAFDAAKILREMETLWRGGVPHESDFCMFARLGGNGKTVRLLDCGANSGQSAISFLINCPDGHVTSFEPNRLYGPVLDDVRSLLGADRFEFLLEGLSEEEGDLDLYIPYVDGVPYLQEASLDLAQFEKTWVVERLRSYGSDLQIKPARAHFAAADSKKLAADAVKIDAEGAEMRVLRGMRETIARCRPIFLIENNDWRSVTDFLAQYGYRPYQWDAGLQRIVEMKGASTNCFYLMEEHFERYPSLR